MARTRIDPWQAEDPDFLWYNISHSSESSAFKAPSTKSYDNHSLPNPNFSIRTLPFGSLQSTYDPLLKFSHHSSKHPSKSLLKSFTSGHPQNTLSEIHCSESASKQDSSKVLANCNRSSSNGCDTSPPKSSLCLQSRLKPKKRRGISSSFGSIRLNRVPNVVLKSNEKITPEVHPTWQAMAPTKTYNAEREIPGVFMVNDTRPATIITENALAIEALCELSEVSSLLVQKVKNTKVIPEIVLDPPEVIQDPPNSARSKLPVVTIFDSPDDVAIPESSVLPDSSVMSSSVTHFVSLNPTPEVELISEVQASTSGVTTTSTVSTVSTDSEILVDPLFSTNTVTFPHKSLPYPKKGFLGFPEEVGKKLKKSRNHVNTNILASSLDLLNLHRNGGMRSGSSLECSHCGIMFSSPRHFTYHQSASFSESSTDPSCFNNVKEDDLWLCLWCPVVCTNEAYFIKHKANCRERGRCHQLQKDPSFRRVAASNARRSTISNAYSASPLSSTAEQKRFKVVHGLVIPVA